MWKNRLDTLKWATKTWELGLKAVSFAAAARDLLDDEQLRKDPWAWADATGRLADLGDSFLKQRDALERMLGGQTKLALEWKGLYPLKGFGTVVSLAVKFKKLSKIRDEGEREGELLGIAGVAIMGMAEVMAGSTLVLAIPVAIGLALQLAGEKYKDHYNASKRFLRWCQFGDPAWHDLSWEDIDEPWYPRIPDPEHPGQTIPRPAKQLQSDPALQLRVLEQIRFDFGVNLLNDGRSLKVRIEPRNFSALNVHSKWSIVHYHYSEAGLGRVDRLQPELVADKDDSTVLRAHVEDLVKGAIMYAPEHAREVRRRRSIVTVSLDAYGDGSTIIERSTREYYSGPY